MILVLLLCIDWIMNETIFQGRNGIWWTVMCSKNHVDEVCFANDLQLLASTSNICKPRKKLWQNCQPKYRMSTFYRTCSKANESKSFQWKFLIFEYVNFQLDHISNFKYHKPWIKTFCFMMDFRNRVIFQKRLKMTKLFIKTVLLRRCI